jgi:carbonic anhydrase/acetyltransferase-like protein (isoleucine patch superfamily)
MIHSNVKTDFSPVARLPEIDSTACVHPLAAVIGYVVVGKRVMIAPFASVRGDEGQPIVIGDESNVQDGVILHGLETEKNGVYLDRNQVQIDGKGYSVFVGRRVSLAHQVQIHGPAAVGDDSFVGMKSLLFRSQVGAGCVVEPACILMGVRIDPGRYVPTGTVLNDQNDADQLPRITADYPFKDLNKGVVHVNTHLAEGYSRLFKNKS